VKTSMQCCSGPRLPFSMGRTVDVNQLLVKICGYNLDIFCAG
jgi:hypothetical protein